MNHGSFHCSRRAAIRAGIGLVLARLLPGQSDSSPASGEAAAAALWERMIEAKGGRERLHGVETLVETIRKRLVFPSPKFKNGDELYVQAMALPDRIWKWQDARPTVFGMSIDVRNLSTGFRYLVYPGNDVRKLDEVRGETKWLEIAQVTIFNETRWVRPKPVRTRTDKEIPRGVTVLETEWGGNRWDFWIHEKDYLPTRILKYEPASWDSHHIIVSYYDLADYRPVEGIQIPHKTSVRYIESKPMSFTPATFILNPRLREDLFSTIPKSEDPADAWKPREEWGR